MSDPIIFYDIPAANPSKKCWSPNTWKARYVLRTTSVTLELLTEIVFRYALNFKGIVYRTEWVEYPDIEALSKRIGAPPTGKWPDSTSYYSLPAIYDPSTKKAVSDSAEIAKYLDETYPDTPTLFPTGTVALQTLFLDWAWDNVGFPLSKQLAVASCSCLNPASQSYYREKREWQVGAPLEALKTEQNWAALEEGLGKLKGYYEANGEGNDGLLGGEQITFADLQIVSYFAWVRVVSPEVWDKVKGLHGGQWAKVLEHFETYEAVDA